MYVSCKIQIEERLHEICVAVPDGYDEGEIGEMLQFAISTALLERSGYLPPGVTHAVA
jgi:hypothetical protein